MRFTALAGVLAILLATPTFLIAQSPAFPRLDFQETPPLAGLGNPLGSPFVEPLDPRTLVLASPLPPFPEPLMPATYTPPYPYQAVFETVQPAFYMAPSYAPVQVVQTACSFAAPAPAPTTPAPSATMPTAPTPEPAPLAPGEELGFWDWCASCVPWLSCVNGCCGERGERFCAGLYECVCCPDPCYQPHWQPLADSAFDAAAVRPVTQQGIRWDAGTALDLPDRSEFFWARADGKGRGPTPNSGLLAVSKLNYNDVSYYFEAAIDRFALIVDVPYQTVDPTGAPSAAGLGDVKFGGKSVLFDCELLQIGAQLLVYAPTGNAARGLGTGHYSLEPSLLLGVRMGPDTYFQGQLSEWIPIGGDPDYAGPVFHAHLAVNHLLCEVHENCPLIGTFGFNSWTFQGGEYTDPVLGANQPAGGYTYLSAGPGLRLFICNHIDVGFGVNFALDRPHLADPLYSTQFRWRF